MSVSEENFTTNDKVLQMLQRHFNRNVDLEVQVRFGRVSYPSFFFLPPSSARGIFPSVGVIIMGGDREEGGREGGRGREREREFLSLKQGNTQQEAAV